MNDIESEALELSARLADHVRSATIEEVDDLIRAGEIGTAIENLCDRLCDDEEKLSDNEASTIQDLANRLDLDRPSISDISELVAAPPHSSR